MAGAVLLQRTGRGFEALTSHHSFAGIAQLAERDLGMIEAIGSIPVSSPILAD